MSIFYEDEIRKVLRKADQSDIENIMAQDPRRKKSWTSKNRNSTRNERKARRNRYDFDDRSDDWGI